jgi:hypothetical protein
MKTENYTTQTVTHGETTGLHPLTGTLTASSLRLFPAAWWGKLSDLKERVSDQLFAEFGGALHAKLIQQAVLEAESLAATTPFPTLFLPALAEEKVRTAAVWSRRQAAIRELTHALAA